MVSGQNWRLLTLALLGLKILSVSAIHRNLTQSEILFQDFGETRWRRLGTKAAMASLSTSEVSNDHCVVAAGIGAANKVSLPGVVYVYRNFGTESLGRRFTLEYSSTELDFFGASVSTSENCEFVVVGGFLQEGAYSHPFLSSDDWIQVAHVFRFNWSSDDYEHLQTLVPDSGDASIPPSGTGMKDVSVAVSKGGTEVALSLQMTTTPGMVLVWHWDAAINHYVRVPGTLVSEEPAQRDKFGSFMKFHTNGATSQLIVGAPQSDDENVGSIQRFEYIHTDYACPSYEFVQKIVPNVDPPPTNCFFGAVFDIASDSDMLVVGAWGGSNETGRVFTFEIDEDTGQYEQFGGMLYEQDLGEKERFGWDLSLIGENRLVVSAYYRNLTLDDETIREGSIFVYDLNTAGCAADNPTAESNACWEWKAELALNDRLRKEFGSAVACVPSGSCAIGAYYDSLYKENGTKDIHHSGSITVVDLTGV